MSNNEHTLPARCDSDDNLEAIRARLDAAREHLERAMSYTMWPEVREELRALRAELARALDCTDK